MRTVHLPAFVSDTMCKHAFHILKAGDPHDAFDEVRREGTTAEAEKAVDGRPAST